MLETLTFKNNWLVKEEYEDQYSKSIISYKLDYFNKYYKDIDDLDDSCFVSTLHKVITNYSTGIDTITISHTKVLSDTEFIIYSTTNDINTAIKYTGRPTLATQRHSY